MARELERARNERESFKYVWREEMGELLSEKKANKEREKKSVLDKRIK